jgi:PAS domain S-box-containing protein
MELNKKLILSVIGLTIVSIVNYILFFDPNSFKDELIFGIFILFNLSLYFFILKPFLGSFQNLFKKVKSVNDKNATIGDQIKALEQLLEHYSGTVEKATSFINDIKTGNLSSEISLEENTSSDNNLSSALVSLRDQMVLIAREEKERNWVTEGMAKFVDILRASNDNSKQFYDTLILNIVKYLNANQGGFFIVENNEKDSHIALASCYAYERKKFLERRIEIGEGLVGQAYLEKETIIMKQVPENYVMIKSGLGDATPKNLLIVPFKINEQVECIVELASFSEFKPYQIEFLEKLGESIASTVSNIRINDNTKKLLEETQANSELLKSQEEELRQSMEELEATQEEMRRKENEMVRLVDKLSENEKVLKEKLTEIQVMKERDEQRSQEMIVSMENQKKTLIEIINKLPQKIFLKDQDGKFLIANQAVADAHHMTVDELLGKSDFDFFDFETAKGYRNAEIEMIEAGKAVYFPEEVFKDSQGNDKILQTTKMPFYIGYLNQTGLLGIQTDITETKKLEQALGKNKKE